MALVTGYFLAAFVNGTTTQYHYLYLLLKIVTAS